MKALVIYDSLYGNTAQVAQAIGEALGGETTVAVVGEVNAAELAGIDLLIVGSPTQGGRPTAAIKAWLAGIPAHALEGKDVTAFDTRLASGERGFALRMLMGLIGYAAPKIAAGLKAKGGRMVASPEGFIVEGREGPLRAGETERVAAWASSVVSRAS